MTAENTVKNEKDYVCDGLKKIDQYITEQLVPRVANIGHVSVEFGKLKSYPNSWAPEREHSISVYKDGNIAYRTGGLSLYFSLDKDYKDRCVYKDWTYSKDLLLYWKEVKQKLLLEIEQKEREYSEIVNFQI